MRVVIKHVSNGYLVEYMDGRLVAPKDSVEEIFPDSDLQGALKATGDFFSKALAVKD